VAVKTELNTLENVAKQKAFKIDFSLQAYFPLLLLSYYICKHHKTMFPIKVLKGKLLRPPFGDQLLSNTHIHQALNK